MVSAQTFTNVAESHGYTAIRLQRRFGNHLVVEANINGRPAALLIDSSAPTTVMHRASAGTFHISTGSTPHQRRGGFGEVINDYGSRRISNLRLGSLTFNDVPIVIADQTARVDPPQFLPISKLKWNAKRKDLHFYTRIDPVDGLLGSDFLRRCAAIIDCGHQVLYLKNAGPGTTDNTISTYLVDRGFARIPMQSAGGKPTVPATLNAEPTRLIIDTGSSFTFFSRDVAAHAHIFAAPMRLAYEAGNRLEVIEDATARQLAIGPFQLENVEVAVANINGANGAGLLGIDQLSMNYAVIDFASSTLYLRHPDLR